MTIFEFFAFLIVSLLAVVAVFQIPLVNDLVTASGYSSAEVFAGIMGLLGIFYSVMLVFMVRAK